MVFPRLLILTEAAVAAEAQGASKTLYELFASYPGPLRIVSCSPGPRDHLDRRRIPRRIVPERLDRLGPHVARARRQGDDWLLDRGPWLRRALRDFQPQVVLACPLTEWGLRRANRVARVAGVPLVSYFMDDWAGTSRAAGAAQLLRRSAAWLMISERLRDDLVERHDLQAPPTMVVHNPARTSSEPRRDRAATGSRGPCRILYAGSIWPMHADAVALAADAVQLLRARGGGFELVVHTSPEFVARHPVIFERDGVIDGGLREPPELQRLLLEADLALVACSFAADQRLMSRSSVQTKLTDYMSAGVPILGVGPEEAASIEFVRRWGVGRCCTSPDVERIAGAIAELAEAEDLREISARARAVVREHFDADEVRERLWLFVALASQRSGPAAQPMQ